MGLLNRRTIDLGDEIEEIRGEDIPTLVDTREEVVTGLEEEYDDWKDVPNDDLADVSRLEEKIKELRGRADLFEDIVERCDDDAEFVLEELTAAQKYAISDEVNEESFEVDMQTRDIRGVPKQGHGMVLTLDAVVESAPDYLERKYDTVGDYPGRLTDWLESEADDLLTSGAEADLEDFTSLRDRIGSSD